MYSKLTAILVLAALPGLLGGLVQAADQPATQKQDTQKQTQTRDQQIYGWQMMTREERDAYHARMREAKTTEQREQIRREHHDQMVARAKERGVTLPDEPRSTQRGPGMGGPGMGGPGPGMGPGPGGGAGPGGGPGRGPRS